MKPLDYFSSLSEAEKLAYADRAECSIHHLRMNLFVRRGTKKQPRPELLIRLAAASEGNVSLREAIDYFLVEPVLRLAGGVDGGVASSHDATGGQRFPMPATLSGSTPALLGREMESSYCVGGAGL